MTRHTRRAVEQRQRRDRTRLLVFLLASLTTAAVVLVSQLHAVYPSPTARAAVQTTSLLGGLLLTYLLFGRFRRTGRLDDLLLANSLCVGVCGNWSCSSCSSATCRLMVSPPGGRRWPRC